MKQKIFLPALCFVLSAFWSCSQSESTPTPVVNPPSNPIVNAEFLASDKDFENFRNWKKVAEFSQAASADGQAHGNGARVVWIKQAEASRQTNNNQYPVGTIVVKEVQNYGIVGMVKRGGSFNAEHQNWEWIYINTEGKILSRNASNLCNNCHLKAKNLDYVFSKP